MAFVSGGAAEVARLRGHRRAVCANRTKVVTCEAAADVWKGEEISKSGACGEPKMGPQDVLKKLPHRYPFLLVDKVLELELGKSIVGIKNVTFNEPQFTGHFPERPIFPGVLMVEALAQVGPVEKGRVPSQVCVCFLLMLRLKHYLCPTALWTVGSQPANG
mmetsp:Transcript_8066/g.24289  ORF Transcript_8066/g.24289 Transcript_8066/m.24289 type:complete len:161 (-) Transcript_8066:1860-2342(-)